MHAEKGTGSAPPFTALDKVVEIHTFSVARAPMPEAILPPPRLPPSHPLSRMSLFSRHLRARGHSPFSTSTNVVDGGSSGGMGIRFSNRPSPSVS